jgi:hypothetical protein
LSVDWKTKLSKIDIVEEYKKTYSVSDILRSIDLDVRRSAARDHIVSILKNEGIYQGVRGLTATHRQKKTQQTMLDRYGVINTGQLPGYGWKNNDTKKTEIQFSNEFKNYCKIVDEHTKINKKIMIPIKYCYYTGIAFADGYIANINPNDPLKRSIDHKTSKWIGFMTDVPPDFIGSVTNLVYCLKYCNTIKNQMNEQMFMPFAKIIREKMINEGHKSN